MQVAGEFINPELQGDPHLMTQEEKDRGLGSVFKRDDERLQQRRERDAREKDPNFISESYSECYPGYQEYNREIVGSDEEEDLTKMDMGGRVCHCSLSYIQVRYKFAQLLSWFVKPCILISVFCCCRRKEGCIVGILSRRMSGLNITSKRKLCLKLPFSSE